MPAFRKRLRARIAADVYPLVAGQVIAQRMGRRRFLRVFRIVYAGFLDQARSAHRRVDDRIVEVVFVEGRLDATPVDIDAADFGTRQVFDDVGVEFVEGAREAVRLDRDPAVHVEQQDFRLQATAFEDRRNHAGPLVRGRGTAIIAVRHVEQESTAAEAIDLVLDRQ